MKRFKTKVIEWCDKDLKLNEGIKTGIEMCFLSVNNKQCTQFFRCKDYLQDSIFNYIHNQNRKVYGFVYDPIIDPPLCLNQTRIMVTNSQDFEFSHKIPLCLDFINQFEKQIKIKKTNIFFCKDPFRKYIRSGVWLFQGSSRWMKSPPMISLYALLIRVGLNHTKDNSFWDTIDNLIAENQKQDAFKIGKSIDGIKKIIKIGDRKIFHKDIKKNFPYTSTINEMHNKLGIISFSQGFSKKFVPYWYRN